MQVFSSVNWSLTYSTKGLIYILITYVKGGLEEGKEKEGKEELCNCCSLGNFLSSSNFHSL